MTLEELNQWQEDFLAFHERFADLFARREPREQALKYVRGLLARVERKNGWQLAEAVGDARPDRTQRLLYQASWDADAARDELQRFVIERFADGNGIGIVDETGFLKQGAGSVGVQRQYSGTAGKVDNCQVGTFLTYRTTKGHAFLDRRLYLPRSWCEDLPRRAAAQVPEEVAFQTKPEQAAAMLVHAWKHGVPMRWVTGDEVYGDSPHLRQTVREQGKGYVLAVSCTCPVWTQRPPTEKPFHDTGGRPRTQERRAEEAPQPTTVHQVVADWAPQRWQRLTVDEGEKGPRTDRWGRQRVVEKRGELPGDEVWLLARRSLHDPTDIAYYLGWSPTRVGLKPLAQVAACRYSIEQCLEEGKGETGLDEYEVRHWQSWHRHITLSMMAHAWLASVRARHPQAGGKRASEWAELTVPEVRRLLEIALPLPPRSPALQLAWSHWRRARRQQARRSHYRRYQRSRPLPDSRRC